MKNQYLQTALFGAIMIAGLSLSAAAQDKSQRTAEPTEVVDLAVSGMT
jgi:hypothetical protein